MNLVAAAAFNIAGFNFRHLRNPTLCGGPGIYVYIHQSTGKCFVRAMRNARGQRGPNNYPNYLKELLKTNKSEVLIFLAELPKDTKEALYLASRAVVSHLSEKGMLYKRPKPNRGGVYRQLPGEGEELYTIWIMTHAKTGAVFYFEEIKGVDVTNKVSQRMLTFNNYVLREVSNANRVMYGFAKKHFPLDVSGWVVRDLDLAFLYEQDALLHITKLSKQHLEAKEVVLSRVSNIDALYYRNSMLRMPHISMEEYLTFEEAE
jgi:hypothetical protein